MQKAFNKYDLDKFNWVIYEYFSYETKIIDNKDLTDLDTSYIKAFDFTTLYNFKSEAISMLGYKDTEEAKQKMIEYFKDKNNHPIYAKNRSEETKKIMSIKKNKYLKGVGIFYLNNNLINKFSNNVELANHLGISKVTVGKYLNNNLIYNNTYRFKPIK